MQEVVEMVQTAGSDVEAYEEDSESGYSTGEEEGGESGSNNETDVEEGEGVRGGSENRSSGGIDGGRSNCRGDPGISEEGMAPGFSVFSCIPDYSDQHTQGLHL